MPRDSALGKHTRFDRANLIVFGRRLGQILNTALPTDPSRASQIFSHLLLLTVEITEALN